jgi:hypothetical protein
MLAVAQLTIFTDLTKHKAVVDGQVYSSSTALYWHAVRSQCAYAHLASVVGPTFSARLQKTLLPNWKDRFGLRITSRSWGIQLYDSGHIPIW